MDKIESLALARGESVEAVRARFSDEEMRRAPKSYSRHIGAVTDLSLIGSGVDDGLAWVRLSSGRIFYSPITHSNLRRQYSFVADLMPAHVTEETFLAAIDVAQRYVTDFTWPPEGLVESGSANIVELGAYLGHKTIRFAEELAGTGGKVLAVEMMPDNCEILRRNIDENGFSDVIEVLPIGVWKESGTNTVYSKGRQRNSILPIDKLSDGEQVEVEVATINQILTGWGVSPIDLLFVTVNGVEVEILEGFNPSELDVRSVFVAAPYDVEGGSNAELCRAQLRKKGYQLIDVGNPWRVVAKKE